MNLDEGKEQIQFDGMVDKILYSNDQGDYTVAILVDLESDEPRKVVGPLGPIKTSTTVRIDGLREKHPRYGEQIRAVRVLPAVPTSRRGILRYLASGAVRGVGPVLAERLVDAFGETTISVIENEPEKLGEIEGLGRKRIGVIRTAWEESREERETLVFLLGLGLGSGLAAKIQSAYSPHTIARVTENPYRLVREISGIGFPTADRIALAIGIAADSPARTSAATLHVLQVAADSGGHAFLPYSALRAQMTKLLSCEEEEAELGIRTATLAGDVVQETLGENPEPSVYLHSIHWTETAAAQRFGELMTTETSLAPFDVRSSTSWAESLLNIELSPGQREAVETALSRKIAVVTGGPGVGKTTVVKSICTIFEAKSRTIALAAPTGRAAKRLQETTARPAKTLHRLLKFDPTTNSFSHDRDRPIRADAIIVDEASMLDLTLFQALLEGLRPESTLILVGDVDQLPSVGAGRVLEDLILTGRVPVARLNKIFRQHEQSRIVTNAHRIQQGHLPELAPPSNAERSDFYFIDQSDSRSTLEALSRLVIEHIPRAFGFDPYREIQVLTPMHKGICGNKNLNRHLKQRLNPNASSGANPEDDDQPLPLEPGDKVMQIRNNYDKEVFNGDVGHVVRARSEDEPLLLEIDGRRHVYSNEELGEIVPAYAITVHKSQGSEYPCVVIPLTTEHRIMLQRNLLYTAVTRAKKLVVLVGSRAALKLAVDNKRDQTRYSGLGMRLQALLP